MDPWTFGWTQLLTLITIGIAIGGFRTLNRWRRREKIEEKKIDIALDALSLAYQAPFVFQSIRSPMAHGGEWKDMPRGAHETEEEWNRRGPFYAIFTRIEHHKDYFEAVWKLQPRFMAVFGRETEEIFAELHSTKRRVEVAAHMLAQTRQRPYEDALERELQTDIWGYPEKDDRVGSKLDAFRCRIEALCFPILNRQFKPAATLKPRQVA